MPKKPLHPELHLLPQTNQKSLENCSPFLHYTTIKTARKSLNCSAQYTILRTRYLFPTERYYYLMIQTGQRWGFFFFFLVLFHKIWRKTISSTYVKQTRELHWFSWNSKVLYYTKAHRHEAQLSEFWHMCGIRPSPAPQNKNLISWQAQSYFKEFSKLTHTILLWLLFYLIEKIF